MSFPSKPIGLADYQQGFIRCYQCFVAMNKPVVTVIKDVNTNKINLCSHYCFDKYKEFDAKIKQICQEKK